MWPCLTFDFRSRIPAPSASTTTNTWAWTRADASARRSPVPDSLSPSLLGKCTRFVGSAWGCGRSSTTRTRSTSSRRRAFGCLIQSEPPATARFTLTWESPPRPAVARPGRTAPPSPRTVDSSLGRCRGLARSPRPRTWGPGSERSRPPSSRQGICRTTRGAPPGGSGGRSRTVTWYEVQASSLTPGCGSAPSRRTRRSRACA